jgi:hypothetical protein
MAHAVVIKLKEMGLPEELDSELATLSTDLGDLWGAQKEMSRRLESFVKSRGSWDEVGDDLVDFRTAIDHIEWHTRSVKRAMNRLTRYAYKRADKG